MKGFVDELCYDIIGYWRGGYFSWRVCLYFLDLKVSVELFSDYVVFFILKLCIKCWWVVVDMVVIGWGEVLGRGVMMV